MAEIGKTIEQYSQLLAYDVGADVLNARDFSGHFRHHAGNGGESINTERAESLEVGLRASPGAAVGSCNGQRDGDCSHLPLPLLLLSGKSQALLE